MRTRARSLLGAVALAFPLLASPVAAQSILYNNGAANGSGDFINAIRILSDDFALPSAVTVTQIRFFTANFTDTPSQYSGTFNWAILLDNAGTPGATLASGTATPVATPFSVIGTSTISQFDITIAALLLGPGTYRLQLQDPFSEGSFYWSRTASVTGAPGYDALTGPRSIDYSFQILGSTSVVPEPATSAMLAFGLVALLGTAARRRAKSLP